MSKKSNWSFYAVKIVKQIVVDGAPDVNYLSRKYKLPDIDAGSFSALVGDIGGTDQAFEESLILVRAQSFEHAFKLAESKSTQYDKPYTNPYGQTITWKFIETVRCYLVDDKVGSGTEVYSCFHHVDSSISADDFVKSQFGDEMEDHSVHIPNLADAEVTVKVIEFFIKSENNSTVTSI